jgi:2-aminoethylphosphonate transport system substrate-binding protein
MGLVAHGPNPAVGQKLIEYLLTIEVQAKIASIYGIPARDDIPPDSPNAQVVRNIIEGVKVMPVDWATVGLKKDAWLKRFREEVVGDSGKQVDVVKPK